MEYDVPGGLASVGGRGNRGFRGTGCDLRSQASSQVAPLHHRHFRTLVSPYRKTLNSVIDGYLMVFQSNGTLVCYTL